MDSKILTIVLLILITCGCSAAEDDLVCTTVAVPGISVQVEFESDLEEPLTEVEIIAQNEDFLDSVVITPSVTSSGFLVYERPGRYDVSVLASGYREWTEKDVIVQLDASGCHVETVQLEAELVLDPGSSPG